MPGGDNQIIGPPNDHDVTVLVLHRQICRGITSRDSVPVLAVALIVPPDRPHHRRPGFLDDQEPACSRGDRVAPPIDDVSDDARDRPPHKSWAHGLADHRGQHVHPGLSLPPGIHDRAPALSDVVVEPFERFWVEGLADRPEDTERREIIAVWPLLAHSHEHPDSSRGSIEDGDAILLDEIPPGARGRIIGSRLCDERGSAVQERAVDTVTVTGDPAGIGGAPVDVIISDIKDVLRRIVGADRIPTAGVHDALRRSGGAARVEDEERILGIHWFSRAFAALAVHQVVVVDLHLRVESHGIVRIAPQDNNPLHTRCVDDCFLDDLFEGDRFAAPISVVSSDDQLCTGAPDPLVERVDAEPTEDNRVDGPNTSTGQHRDDLLGHHRHVDADPVALPDAETRKTVCEPADCVEELTVGVGPLLVLGLAPPYECDLIASLVLNVTVQTVVGDVELSVQEPPGIWVIPLLHLIPGLEPLELTGDPIPESVGVCQERLVGLVVAAYPGLFPVPDLGGIVLRLLEFDTEIFSHPITSILHY